MKILVFEQRYTRQNEPGIGRFNIFARHWAEQGHQIYVVAGMINYITGKKSGEYKGKFFVKEKDGENATVFRVFDSVLGYRTFPGRLWSYFSFLFSALFTALFLVPKPDVVIASSPPIFIGVLGYLVGIFKREPFIFEVRDLWPDEAVELGFLKNKVLIKLSLWLEKFLYKHSHSVVVNSPGLKDFLISKKFVSARKISVIPNPVDLENLLRWNLSRWNLSRLNLDKHSVSKKFGWDDKFVVLYSGSMAAVYDFDIVLEAAKQLKDESILFVFLGDGRQKKEIRREVEREKINNVQFLEPVGKSELPNIIGAADLCIASLKKEVRLLKYVYASKIFDYMAAGKPIVLAMEGVSADLVCGKAEAGICVLPGDQENFQKAILDLYNNSFLRTRLGQNGFLYLKNNFNPEKLAEAYLAVIK